MLQNELAIKHGLLPQQTAFITKYMVNGFSARQAARDIGFDDLAVSESHGWLNPTSEHFDVAMYDYMTERLESELGATVDATFSRVVQELKAIAFSNVRDFLVPTKKNNQFKIEVDASTTRKDLAAIKKIVIGEERLRTKDGCVTTWQHFSVMLNDRPAALVALAFVLGYTNKPKVAKNTKISTEIEAKLRIQRY